MKKLALVVFGFLFSLEVAAASSGYVDITDNNIQLISSGPSSRLFIYDVTMNDSPCENKDTPVIMFSDNEIAKEMYAMVLAAKTAGKKISFFSASCVDMSGVTYTLVTSTYLD
ncbi:hypothetical protein [Microbulbifer variabilis]|uniref:hypothetical protein n=1 Tax=Microbulbifer variabilis TaxID=266805 RepID=UPI00037C0538|nr:hypothetical protein [Microbulbifer variabilis]